MPTTIKPAVSRSLALLVDDLDRAARYTEPGRSRVDAVAAALRPELGDPDLLRPDQTVGDPTAYRQHLLHVAPDGLFSLVALVWLPGQATPIHDHLAWCVVGIHRGAEHEERYRLRPDGTLVPTGHAVAHVGSVDGLLPPGDIHRVHNTGNDLAISLHVYGADLTDVGTSIRRRYDEDLVVA
jgi:predicted metal-dependent enzyme (double-stranded beta helix superfamily)